MKDIHPNFDRLLSRKEREQRLGQCGRVLWLTGLSGAGKSTLAEALERSLFEDGFLPQVLDGDNIRAGINNNLGFSLEDRHENIRRIAEVARLYAHSGLIAITAFISPTIAMRELARQIIGEDDFVEIYISTSLEVCEQRDTKGLYAKARRGELKNFTGIDSPYEPPLAPWVSVDTQLLSPEESLACIKNAILPRLQPKDLSVHEKHTGNE